jgi:hypothetical protein
MDKLGFTAVDHVKSDRLLDKAKIKFLLLEGLHPRDRGIIESEGYTNIVEKPGALTPEELKQALKGVRVIFQDIENKLPLGNAEVRSSLEALLKEADGDIGYVVMDVESDNVSVLMKDLAEIPATIRTRILH